MAFANVAAIVAAVNAGKIHQGYLRKVPGQVSVAGQWVDLSMAPGSPPPNYYASTPLVAATLDSFRGIFHGDDVAPATKRLIDIELCVTSANGVGPLWLLDYLLYYPFIDMDDTSLQTMDNTVVLPRYADGDGVRAMLVALTPTVGGGSFTYDYVNQNGDARTSPVITCTVSALNIGTLVSSHQAGTGPSFPFLPMQSGDTGIRQITGVTMIAPEGGLGAMVLVKPLAETRVSEIGVPEQHSLVHDRVAIPEVLGSAYLGLVLQPASNINGIGIVGRLGFVWD